MALLRRAGKLRLLRGLCALAFRDSWAYWGHRDEARLERCCLRACALRGGGGPRARARGGRRSARAREPGLRPGLAGRLAEGRRRCATWWTTRSGPAGKLFCVVRVLVGASGCLLPQHHAGHPRRRGAGKCRPGSWAGHRLDWAGLGVAETSPAWGGGGRGDSGLTRSRLREVRLGEGTSSPVALGTPAPLVETGLLEPPHQLRLGESRWHAGAPGLSTAAEAPHSCQLEN